MDGMRLATLKSGGRDGTLVVVSDDHGRCVPAGIPTLQAALEDWPAASAAFAAATAQLADGDPIDLDALHAPLPRAFQWAEGSTYHAHMERMRASRGAELPPDHGAEPAVYNSGSDRFLAPREPIVLADVADGLDLEATIAVIIDDVPMGTKVGDAEEHIKLVVLVNDLTLRNVLPREWTKGVGFYQCKPARSFAPFAVAREALGDAWAGGILHATVECRVNGELLGALDSGRDCAFDFPTLIAYMARTRSLAAGTIIGSGTVANRDPAGGFGAVGEKRAVEIVTGGEPRTPWLGHGDRVRIEAFGADGRSLFGALDQTVVPA
jgi:fumarylacetoacetate (FAA) hydrolase